MFKKIKRQCAYKQVYQDIAFQGSATYNAYILCGIVDNKEGEKMLAAKIKKLHDRMVRLESKMWWITKKLF